MFNLRLAVAGFATLVFMSIGCSNKESNSVNEVKENPSETIAKKIGYPEFLVDKMPKM